MSAGSAAGGAGDVKPGQSAGEAKQPEFEALTPSQFLQRHPLSWSVAKLNCPAEYAAVEKAI